VSATLPTDDQVRQAMTRVLAQARQTGRRPTVTAVEHELGITHPTFYRNYPDLITWFRQQAATPDHAPAPATSKADPEPGNLRRENRELRTRVALYAEAIRQLTLDNTALRAELDAHAKVIDLSAQSDRRSATERTGQRDQAARSAQRPLP
jgi:hypothetical protein